MNFSYWERQFISTNADLIIIGGGITGLSTAYHARLKHPNWNIIVVEQFARSNAASTRNAGFSCFGSAGELTDDLNSGSSLSEVLSTVEKRFKGLELLRKTINDQALEYDNCGGMELFDRSQLSEFEEVSNNLEVLNSELRSITRTAHTYTHCHIPEHLFGYSNAIYNHLEGKLNPGKMMVAWRSLCKENGVEIYNGSKATIAPDHSGIHLNNHFIKSNQLAICTNGLTDLINVKLEVKPARNLVLLSEPLAQIKLPSTYHHLQGYMYFRKIHDRVLIGGGRHEFKEEEFSSEFTSNPNVKAFLLDYLKKHLNINPSQIEQEWTGIMGVADSKETIVKRISENLVCGVRLGGMGVAIGTLIGKEVAELLD